MTALANDSVSRFTPRTPIYDDGPAGFVHFGQLNETERGLLQRATDETKRVSGDHWAESCKAGEHFWVNIWQRSGDDGHLPIAEIRELDRWARAMVDCCYAGEPAECDGYGLMVNPVGTRAQGWHLDYGTDYSTLFIPLTELTPENATEYVVCLDEAAIAARDKALNGLDHGYATVALSSLTATGGSVSVRQLIAPPFSVLRMDFGTLHRGIPNTGNFDRILFWVSVKRPGALLPPERRFAKVAVDRETDGR